MKLRLFALLTALSSTVAVLGAPICGLVPPKQTMVNAHATGSNATEDVLVTAWYPGWLGNTFTPDKISWSKYTDMTFAFGVTTPDVNVISLDDISQQILPVFVQQAKSNNVKALLSIGGWTGSLYFSPAVATQENRTAFVKTVVGLATKYQLDGIDFDWEYPNKQGIGCNAISPDDSANFLAFLQQLRQDPVGQNLILTAAVGITPFNGPDGTPMNDVSGFAKVLDHIAIMAYDIWGSWSTGGVGPNAPLQDSCATMPQGSGASAVQAWTTAGFPANQIALGVPAYGHSFQVNKNDAIPNGGSSAGNLTLYAPFNKAQQPLGTEDDGYTAGGVDQCGNPVGPSGIFTFAGLVQKGFLNQDGTAAPGMVYQFDSCSKTPFIYDPNKQVMVSFDDAQSFAAKGQFIDAQGLKGFAVWDVTGDFNDILVGSISDAMGIDTVCSA